MDGLDAEVASDFARVASLLTGNKAVDKAYEGKSLKEISAAPVAALSFHVSHVDPGSRARRGTLVTGHGVVETPAFMAVGTRATVTGLTPQDLADVGAQVVLGNTYHLLLRPGPELFRRVGGIHRFMRWHGPVLTDSGGYQIFSLSADRTIREEGAKFVEGVLQPGARLAGLLEGQLDGAQVVGADDVGGVALEALLEHRVHPPEVNPFDIQPTRLRLRRNVVVT